ncbi:MAG: hypothetical protein SPI35_03890 [Porphyromonas sp.]|nr:hypothetical protein [Porphyromonas sp.]
MATKKAPKATDKKRVVAETSISADVLAVIALSITQAQGLEETTEPRVLTIKHSVGVSSWSLKSHNMRIKPTLIEY